MPDNQLPLNQIQPQDNMSQISDVETRSVYPDERGGVSPSNKSPRPLILGLIVLVLLLASALGYMIYQRQTTSKIASINSYQDCVAAGNGQTNLMYPPQCTTPDGRTFTDPTAKPVEMAEETEPSQLEDLTANWKTYTNNQAHFQVQYPPDWQLEVVSSSKNNPNITNGFSQIKLTHLTDQIVLTSGDGFGGALCGTPDSWTANWTLVPITTQSGISKLCKSYETHPVVYEGNCGDCGGLSYQNISYVQSLSVTPESEAIALQILSTFKLITGQTEVSQDNWKLYQGNNFQFKYPENISIQPDTNYIDISDGTNSILLTNEPLSTHSLFNPSETSNNYVVENNITWTYISSSEYCDTGSCSELSAALQVVNKNTRYTIVLQGTSPDSTMVNQILSTFKFID